jgi:phosphohistidine phosphatase
MKLYVVRHGPAEDHAPTGRDADRALTASGRDRVRSVARELVAHDEAPFLILSSPLVRALQTAEIVAAVTTLDVRVRDEPKAQAAGATGAVEIRRELAPGGDAYALVLRMAHEGRKRVMVVGHEPDLSMLVSQLVGRAPAQGMLKAMVVGVKLVASSAGEALEPEDKASGVLATLRFVLDPKTLAWQHD